jgi:hypothetical protein
LARDEIILRPHSGKPPQPLAQPAEHLVTHHATVRQDGFMKSRTAVKEPIDRVRAQGELIRPDQYACESGGRH